jgi:hypothetical protein
MRWEATVINQREIINLVRGMRAMELLELVLKYPYFLTDAYFAEIAKAVRARHEELRRSNILRR